MGKRWDTGDHGSINGYTHGEKTPIPDHGSKGYTHAPQWVGQFGRLYTLGHRQSACRPRKLRRLASMGKRWDTGDHGSINGYTHGEKTPTPDHGPTGIPMHPSGWDSLDAYIPLATDKVPVDPDATNGPL